MYKHYPNLIIKPIQVRTSGRKKIQLPVLPTAFMPLSARNTN